MLENALKQSAQLFFEKSNARYKQVAHQNEMIDIKLVWNKPIETSSLTNGRNIILQNISKRLQLIYPQSHELKMMIETEKIFIDLRINLKKAIN